MKTLWVAFFSSLLSISTFAHDLQSLAQNEKPRYGQSSRFDPQFFMKNHPWYNGRIFVYLPQNIGPSVQNIVTTTTSVVITQVTTPYTTVLRNNSWQATPWAWDNNILSVIGTKPAGNTYNIVTSVNTPDYLASYSNGGYAPSYWVNNGTPTGFPQLYAAYNDCLSNYGGNCVPLHIDGAGTYWAGSQTNVTSVNTTTALPSYTLADGTLVHDRTVTYVYYDETQQTWRRSVVQVTDVNENGVIDAGDTVTEAYQTQSRNNGGYEYEVEEGLITREERREETTTTVTQKKKHRWKFDLAPLIFFDIQTPTKLVSLDSQHKVNAVATVQNAPALKWADSRKGFVVTKRAALTLGAGVSATAQYSGLQNGVFTVGLAPLIGSEAIFETYAKNGQEAEKVQIPSIPKRIEDLKSWKNGDRLTFGQDGGVLFMPGFSYGPLFAGASAFAIGKWRTEVQKISATQYYVSRSQAELRNFGLAAGVQVLSTLSVSDFRSSDDAFSMLFDISNKKAREAMENFLFKGETITAQSLADKKGQTVVLKVKKERTVMRGRLASISLGLPPFITGSWGWGRVTTHQETLYFPDNTKGDALYAMYQRSRDGRFFNWSENLSAGFTGAHYRVSEAKKNGKLKESGLFGQFAFSYSDNNAYSSELQNAIKELVGVTGLDALSAQVPRENGKDTLLGSAEVQFLLTFDDSATRALMELATHPQATSKLLADTEKFRLQYFRAHGLFKLAAEERIKNDPLNVCGRNHGYDIERCRNESGSEAKWGVRKGLEHLNSMKSALDSQNREAFVKAYAEFGREIMRSPFTFQAFMKIAIMSTQGAGLSAQYKIQSTRLKSYQLSPTWDQQLIKASSQKRN